MSQEVTGLHLVLGDEDVLVERAVAEVLRDARVSAGNGATPANVPVDRLRAGEVNTGELAELLSPSLFADERVVVLESAGEARGKPGQPWDAFKIDFEKIDFLKNL